MKRWENFPLFDVHSLENYPRLNIKCLLMSKMKCNEYYSCVHNNPISNIRCICCYLKVNYFTFTHSISILLAPPMKLLNCEDCISFSWRHNYTLISTINRLFLRALICLLWFFQEKGVRVLIIFFFFGSSQLSENLQVQL